MQAVPVFMISSNLFYQHNLVIPGMEKIFSVRD